MTNLSGFFGGGGSGGTGLPPINSTIMLNRSEDLVEIDGAVFLKSGVVETDRTIYPNAKFSEYLGTGPEEIIGSWSDYKGATEGWGGIWNVSNATSVRRWQYTSLTPPAVTYVGSYSTPNISYSSVLYRRTVGAGTVEIAVRTNGTIYWNDLIDPYNPRIMPFNEKSVLISTQFPELATYPNDIWMTPDRTRLFVTDGSVPRATYQYTLTTPGDLSTAVYDNVVLDYTAQSASTIHGVAFSSDGTCMMVGDQSGNLRQYDLSTPWDLSSAVYSGVTVAIGGYQNIRRVTFYRDNTLLVSGSGATFELGTAKNLSTIRNVVYPSIGWGNLVSGLVPDSISFSEDGHRVFVFDATKSSTGYEFATDRPFEVFKLLTGATETITQQGTAVWPAADARGVYVNPTGEYVYLFYSGSVYCYTASTLFSPTGMTHWKTVDLSVNESIGGTSYEVHMRFTDDGTRFFIGTDRGICQYDLTTPWDLDTATLSFVADPVSNAYTYALSADGTLLLSIGSSANGIFLLTTPFDLASLNPVPLLEPGNTTWGLYNIAIPTTGRDFLFKKSSTFELTRHPFLSGYGSPTAYAEGSANQYVRVA